MSKALNNIDLTAAQRKEVAALLQRYLPDTEVWAYGSRVKCTAKPHSDLDMVAFAAKEQSQAVASLREAFEESYLPFRVDLFVWDEVPEGFQRNIEEVRVVVQEKKHSKNPSNNWKILTLSTIINLIGGGTPKRSNQAYWNGNIPWLSVKDFNNQYRYVDSAEETITELGEQESSTKVLKTGQLIISARGTVGALAQLTQPMAFNQSCYGIDAKREYTDNDFLYYLVKHSIDNLKQITHGAVFDTITRETFNHIKVSLPPPPEQKAIAQILGSLDNKIELNRRMNETLEAMAQALFKSWFVDFDPVIDNALAAGNPIPDELKKKAAIRQGLGDKRKSLPDHIRRLFPSEFAYTEEMGWVPKGWKPQTIDSIIEIDPAVNLPKNTVAPFVDMKALPFKGYSVTAINKKPYAGGAKFQNGDVLLARITPCLENGKTAIVDFLDSGQVGFGSTEFIVLRGKAPIPTPFVACLSRNAEFREHCIKSMVGSSGRQRVQKDCFSKFYLSLPEKDMLLDKFFLLTEKNFEQAHKRSKKSQLLADLRDTLLPKLLSGEIFATRLEKSEGGLCPIQ